MTEFVSLSDETETNAKPQLRIRSNIHAGGLGDRIADFTHATGLDKLAQAYTQVTGQDCGCQQRQETLNQMFPTM